MKFTTAQRLFFWGSVLAGVALVCSATFHFTNTPTGKVIDNTQYVHLALAPVIQSALIFIAEEKGYFKEEGLSIKYYEFHTGKLSLDALLGGGADVATVADVPIALAGLAKQKISVVGTIEFSNDNLKMIARKDAGIYAAKDLRGKTIATVLGGGPLFFTDKFLEKHSISQSDVDLVFLAPNDMVASLIRGDIDAFVFVEPYPFLARRELGEDNVVVFNPADLYGETWNIVVKDDFLLDNPEVLNKFLRALLKADQFRQEHPEETVSIIAKHTEVEKEIIIQVMEKQNYGVVLNDLLPTYLEKEAIWAIDKGFTSNSEIPDYNRMIETTILEELNPNGVTI